MLGESRKKTVRQVFGGSRRLGAKGVSQRCLASQAQVATGTWHRKVKEMALSLSLCLASLSLEKRDYVSLTLSLSLSSSLALSLSLSLGISMLSGVIEIACPLELFVWV